MHEHPASDVAVAPLDASSDLEFALPAELIAQTPAPARDAARLLVLRRGDGGLAHHAIADLPALLAPGDLLVFNDVRVRPARLHGRSDGGGAVELLFVRALAPGRWECLGRPGKRLRPGARVHLPAGGDALVVERGTAGRLTVALPPALDVVALLEAHGELPLPPYIRRPAGPLPVDLERYQTVFARAPQAIAAPTAGLHFTPALLDAVVARGVARAFVTLAVGPATFLPLRGAARAGAALEPEWAEIPVETVTAIRRARAAGGRVIAVGTTTTRALESAAGRPDGLQPGGFWAEAFIQPGFRFRVVDALLTNFHLPGSSLLRLVGAFAGEARIRAAYAAAIAARYRFYSYGDAMLIA